MLSNFHNAFTRNGRIRIIVLVDKKKLIPKSIFVTNSKEIKMELENTNSTACEICTESFNKRRQNIQCQFCDFAACSACYKTYLLTINKPGCMSQECKGEWSRAFIYKNFPSSFVTNELKYHLKDVLYQSQIALMPETQTYIEAQNHRDELRIEIYKLNRVNNDIAIELRKLEECKLKSWNSDTFASISQLKHDIENKWSKRENVINELVLKIPTRLSNVVRKNVEELLNRHPEYTANRERLTELYAELDTPSNKKERSNFIRKCGDAECRGFLSTRWKCGLCEQSTCSKCHEFLKETEQEKEKEHVCNPDNVATAQLLAADTKACPKCQTNIYKIDGCDQMWCTQCHTGFSWKSGKIEMKLHNPHYYEWQRKNGGLARAVGDVQCGRVLDHLLAGDIQDRLTKLKNDITDETVYVSDITACLLDNAVMTTAHIIRNCIHMMAYERDEVDVQNQNLQLRIRYLVKDLNEYNFKQKLMMLDTKYAKEQEIRTITQLLTTTITDIMYRFKDSLNLVILKEVDAIVEYVNHCLLETGKVFKMASIIQFEPNLNITKRTLPSYRTL